MPFSPFTVKVLARLEFKLILVLNVSIVNKKKCGAKQPVYMTSATMVIETCDHCFRPKSRLVQYPNCETIGNNDKQ